MEEEEEEEEEIPEEPEPFIEDTAGEPPAPPLDEVQLARNGNELVINTEGHVTTISVELDQTTGLLN
eukprot:12911420-Prorocentrum_lima.AAC.1